MGNSLANIQWLTMCVSLVVQIAFNCLEQNMRMMEPWFLLSQRHAPLETLFLDYTTTSFLTITALRRGHCILASVGYGTSLASILVIIATAKQPPGVLGTTYDIVISSLSAILLILLMDVIVRVCSNRRHPILPRQPKNIACVLAYLHQSKMVHNFHEPVIFQKHVKGR